jgi:hypothetical protein
LKQLLLPNYQRFFFFSLSPLVWSKKRSLDIWRRGFGGGDGKKKKNLHVRYVTCYAMLYAMNAMLYFYFYPYRPIIHQKKESMDDYSDDSSPRSGKKIAQFPATTVAGFGRPLHYCSVNKFYTTLPSGFVMSQIDHTDSLRSVPCRKPEWVQVSVLVVVRAHLCFFTPTPWPLVAMICNRSVKTSKLLFCSGAPLSKGCLIERM